MINKTTLIIKKIPILVLVGVFLIILSTIGLLVSVITSNNSLDARSEAASSGNVSLMLFPSNVNITPNIIINVSATIKLPTNKIVSAVQLRVTYDPNLVQIEDIVPKDWQNKTPVILEPFSTQQSGSKKIAKITLGSFCDQTQCYPILNNGNSDQEFTIADIKVKGKQEGESTISLERNSNQQLNNIIITNDQAFNSWNTLASSAIISVQSSSQNNPTPTPTISTSNPSGKEIVLFDEEVDFTEADNGFHHLMNFNDSLPSGAPSNWKSPDDYHGGTWYFRYNIHTHPTGEKGAMQICVWDQGFKPENCSPNFNYDGTDKYYVTASPSKWWKLNGVPLDFTNPDDYRISVVLRGTGNCNVTKFDVDKPCWDQWPKYKDMVTRITVIMVPAGKTFSGWENYP